LPTLPAPETLTQAMANQDIQTILEQRLGPHARQRLEIEKEAQAFGQGIRFFPENLPLSSVLIRAVLMATGLYWRGIRNAAKIAIRHNRIDSPHLPNAFDGFTIVQLSDLHVEMSETAMERVIELLGEAHYDLCVLTGDYRGGTCGPYDTTLAGMARVRDALKGESYRARRVPRPRRLLVGQCPLLVLRRHLAAPFNVRLIAARKPAHGPLISSRCAGSTSKAALLDHPRGA
jgi:hypothetical protein